MWSATPAKQQQKKAFRSCSFVMSCRQDQQEADYQQTEFQAIFSEQAYKHRTLAPSVALLFPYNTEVPAEPRY